MAFQWCASLHSLLLFGSLTDTDLRLFQNEFVEQYNDGKVSEPELDVYFLHDRAVRESGLFSFAPLYRSAKFPTDASCLFLFFL